eukprot:SM000087S23374  [mRNA]  locus=s87:305209:307916:- [translate_table: standard]
MVGAGGGGPSDCQGPAADEPWRQQRLLSLDSAMWTELLGDGPVADAMAAPGPPPPPPLDEALSAAAAAAAEPPADAHLGCSPGGRPAAALELPAEGSDGARHPAHKRQRSNANLDGIESQPALAAAASAGGSSKSGAGTAAASAAYLEAWHNPAAVLADLSLVESCMTACPASTVRAAASELLQALKEPQPSAAAAASSYRTAVELQRPPAQRALAAAAAAPSSSTSTSSTSDARAPPSSIQQAGGGSRSPGGRGGGSTSPLLTATANLLLPVPPSPSPSSSPSTLPSPRLTCQDGSSSPAERGWARCGAQAAQATSVVAAPVSRTRRAKRGVRSLLADSAALRPAAVMQCLEGGDGGSGGLAADNGDRGRGWQWQSAPARVNPGQGVDGADPWRRQQLAKTATLPRAAADAAAAATAAAAQRSPVSSDLNSATARPPVSSRADGVCLNNCSKQPNVPAAGLEESPFADIVAWSLNMVVKLTASSSAGAPGGSSHGGGRGALAKAPASGRAAWLPELEELQSVAREPLLAKARDREAVATAAPLSALPTNDKDWQQQQQQHMVVAAPIASGELPMPRWRAAAGTSSDSQGAGSAFGLAASSAAPAATPLDRPSFECSAGAGVGRELAKLPVLVKVAPSRVDSMDLFEPKLGGMDLSLVDELPGFLDGGLPMWNSFAWADDEAGILDGADSGVGVAYDSSAAIAAAAEGPQPAADDGHGYLQVGLH